MTDEQTPPFTPAGSAEHPPNADAELTDLFERYASRVYGYARLRTSPETADDVVADTFLTAWRLRERIPDDPLPWLLVIARNALANRQRSERRSSRLTVAMSAVERLAAHEPAADEAATDREAMLGALARLTDDEREAVLLTAWQGLTHHDAALPAGCTERTLARRLRRARRHISSALDPPVEDVTPHLAADTAARYPQRRTENGYRSAPGRATPQPHPLSTHPSEVTR